MLVGTLKKKKKSTDHTYMQLIGVVQEPNINPTDNFFSLQDHGPDLFLNRSKCKQHMATDDLGQKSSFQVRFLITDKKVRKE